MMKDIDIDDKHFCDELDVRWPWNDCYMRLIWDYNMMTMMTGSLKMKDCEKCWGLKDNNEINIICLQDDYEVTKK